MGFCCAGIGPYVEVAFYHKRSRTLLVTDAVIFVPRQPPECISKESLLASAENGLAVKILSKGREVPQEPVVDNKSNRQKGDLLSDPKFPRFDLGVYLNLHVHLEGLILDLSLQLRKIICKWQLPLFFP